MPWFWLTEYFTTRYYLLLYLIIRRFRYCIAAVGNLGEEAYASPQECSNVRVRFHSRATGSVTTSTGVGVGGVAVTGFLLDGGEKTINDVTFVDPSKERSRRKTGVYAAIVQHDVQSFNWRMNRTCPGIPIARDNLGRPMNAGWKATSSGQFDVASCPSVGAEAPSSIRRRCGADGTWQEPQGACPAAISAYDNVAPGSQQYLLDEMPLMRMAYTTLDICAWRCLHNVEACRAYLYTKETQSCVLYGAEIASDFLPANNWTGLHRIKTIAVADTRPLSTVAPSTAESEVWCSLSAGLKQGTGSAVDPFSIADTLPDGLSHDGELGSFFECVTRHCFCCYRLCCH